MSKLNKITDVFLYVGMSETAADQFAAKKLLDNAKIPYTMLSYNDEKQHDSVFSSLNTWNWKNKSVNKLNQFPIIHWKEYYDDFEQNLFVAHGLKEIKQSTLLENKNLIEKIKK